MTDKTTENKPVEMLMKQNAHAKNLYNFSSRKHNVGISYEPASNDAKNTIYMLAVKNFQLINDPKLLLKSLDPKELTQLQNAVFSSITIGGERASKEWVSANYFESLFITAHALINVYLSPEVIQDIQDIAKSVGGLAAQVELTFGTFVTASQDSTESLP